MKSLGKKLKSLFGSRPRVRPNQLITEVTPSAEDLSIQVATIRDSLLFDDKWYRHANGFGEYLDAAEHYLTVGWKQGLNPSPFFDNEEYLTLYPEVRQQKLNPLLHFEMQGFRNGYYRAQIARRRKDIAAANPACCSNMQGGYLRLRITNACNAKCRYCGVRNTFGTEREHAMEPKWYYEYLLPLYERLNMVMITGGDAFVAKESYNYLKFMCEKYPQITLHTESNGIAFNQNFRELAAKHLIKTHFSINASNKDVFARSCWEGEGGSTAYEKLTANIDAYIKLLRSMGREVFAPSMSMVINHDNIDDILNFTRLSLTCHAWYTCFFFDYTENDMNGDYFGRPEESRAVLKTLMEIERVLAGYILFYFRLWIPGKEAEPLQSEVEAEPISELKEKYRDLLELAQGRSVEKEWLMRNKLRREQGKRELTMAEDFAPTVRLETRQEREMCFAPWGELDLYPSGQLDFCGWFEPTLNFTDYVHDGHLDLESLTNSFAYMSARKRILNGNFRGCQICCPMNSVKNPIVPVMKYGFDRLRISR